MRSFDALHAYLRVTLVMLLLPSAALAQRSPSDSSVAFTHATVIDGAGGPPRGGMTVVVRGGRIVRVGKDETVRVLHGARIIDARGKYLTPGFWDMHVHVAKAGSSSLALFIANGITSVRDMGGDFAMIRSLRDSESGYARWATDHGAGPDAGGRGQRRAHAQRGHGRAGRAF